MTNVPYPKMMVKYFSQYSPVDTVDDDSEKLAGDAESADPRLKPRTLRLWLTHGILICTSVLSFTLWMRTPSTRLRNDIPSIYSPANVAIEPMIARFNGTLNFPSIYRGPPSPEVDAAWNRIGRNVAPVRMTHEEMLKAGATNLRSKVRYPDKVGGGYMASLEYAHQLHCVNLLRKASWLEYYEPADISFQTTPETVRLHLDHCIEMIRQNIMCNADVTMITWYWVQGHTVPYPNFNTRHRCRNFEKIMDWSLEHAIHIDETEVIRSKDTVDLPRHQRVTS
ncbi:uncharacterized protein BJ212DRAFT_1378162 [Suillus subaureus]|uniref:Tat pathway signal sequence n=1 Tax=Suillus subaureus TaxID=48587 RepID=A0A9P7E4U1_9AGAM|nr:uncharacterized protein BJ212DRAFT_1378162 [Suillus subaureus]KAG1810691.1 hypothetical protein BJ212DRAFT_1378162 [Suillus subaureus]